MLDDGILLQVNATVIAGVLILLTMSKYPEKSTMVFEPHKKSKRKLIRYLAKLFSLLLDRLWVSMPPRLGTGIIVIPFSISSICILMWESPHAMFKEFFNLGWATIFSSAGFLYLILVIIMLRTPTHNDEKGNITFGDIHSE